MSEPPANLEAATPAVSVIIPTLNEQRCIAATIDSAKQAAGVAVIVVDGGSSDDTVAIAKAKGACVLSSPCGQGMQMNRGAAVATGEVLLFLHADTRLPANYDQAIKDTLSQHGCVAGAFDLHIDATNRTFRFVERLVRWRCRQRQMPYGDQALFMPASTFNRLGGFAPLPVMEDYELVRRLRRCGKIGLADAVITTSARRWLAGGIWRTTWIHQKMIMAYHLGATGEQLAAMRRTINPDASGSRDAPAQPTRS